MRCLRVPAALAVTLAAVAAPIGAFVSFGCHHGTGPENDALIRGFDARGTDGGIKDAGRDARHDAPVDADAGVPEDAPVDAGSGSAGVGP